MTFIHTPMNHGVYMTLIITLLVFATYTSFIFLFCKDNKNNSECLFHRLLALCILLIVIYLSVHRDTFLPFIGETVFPFTLVKDVTFKSHQDTVSKTVHVDAPDGTKVAFWASMPNNNVEPNVEPNIEPTPEKAYDHYQNSGITLVKNNQAVLTVKKPAAYNIPPFHKTLEKHIHYRVIYTNGMLSEIHTVRV